MFWHLLAVIVLLHKIKTKIFFTELFHLLLFLLGFAKNFEKFEKFRKIC
jgi:hypothetical protein